MSGPPRRDLWRAIAVMAAMSLVLGTSGCGGSKAPSVARLTGTSSAAGRNAARSPKRPGRAALAACFRARGFQATVGSVGNNTSTKVISIGGVIIPGADPDSPHFQQTMQACRRYLPGGGPPKMSPAQRAEWAKGMARFAACMRKHGVPNFPDPNPNGMDPFRNMAKIDASSPVVAKASKTCEPLESKVGPQIRLG